VVAEFADLLRSYRLSVVVGDRLYPGALEAATLSRLIQEARAR